MLSLTAAVASITSSGVLDLEWLLGLGPAVVLTAGALAAVPAGRAMDRPGRAPVLVAGFGVGAAGCGLAALGRCARGSALAVLAGLAGVGTANGATLLARPRPGTCTCRSAGPAASPWCCSARCSARSSDRPSSAPAGRT